MAMIYGPDESAAPAWTVGVALAEAVLGPRGLRAGPPAELPAEREAG